MRSIFLVAAIALSTTACVAPYQPPKGQPVGHVRITTDTDDNTSVFVIDRNGCESGLAFIGVQALSRDESQAPRVVIGESQQPLKRTRERTLEANKRVDLVVMSGVGGPGVGGYSCKIGVTFVPKEGAHYELSFSRAEATRSCNARLSALVTKRAGVVTREEELSTTYYRPNRPVCTNR